MGVYSPTYVCACVHVSVHTQVYVYTHVYTTHMCMYVRVRIRIGVWNEPSALYRCGEKNNKKIVVFFFFWGIKKAMIIAGVLSWRVGFVGSLSVPCVVRPSTVFAIAPQPRWGRMWRGERAMIHTNCLELRVRKWSGLLFLVLHWKKVEGTSIYMLCL